jgi:MFS transporter, PPP family, 3-phenylpropionic acid transporter
MRAGPVAIPYLRLSGFYFLNFAFIGVMLPYWSLYLQAIGHGAAAIGAISAGMALVRILAPNLWGWMADRKLQRIMVIRLGAVMGLLSLAALPWRHDFAWVLGVSLLNTFFLCAIMPQFEALTLACLGDQLHRYGQVRLWGSVSFVFAVIVCGWLFDRIAVTLLPWFLIALLVLLVLGSLWLRDTGTARKAVAAGGLLRALRSPVLLAFMAAFFLLQFSHAPYYTFFSLYLDAHGFGRAQIGLLWGLGVIAEIALFALSHHLLRRWSVRDVLMLSLFLAALRWLMIGYGVDSIGVLVLAQLLHAATYGSAHAAGMVLLRRHFEEGLQGQGQALYGAFCYGGGGAAGAAISGQLWELSPRWCFVMAAVAALAAGGIVWRFVRGSLVELPSNAAIDLPR